MLAWMTPGTARRSLVLALLLAACGRDAGAPDAGTGMDASVPRDASPTIDAPRIDAGPVCVPPSEPPEHAGCHPTDGVECDGDWEGRCDPACDASECCSPQHNAFECVPRAADGSCPAPDLFVDGARIAPRVEYRYFGPSSCAVAERCVAAPGMRRLLRFDTWTPNQGEADVYLGAPGASSPHFVYSACHRHHHFESYAAYELLDAEGECVVAEGHKQAFCLLDHFPYPCDPDGSNEDPEVPDCRRTTGYHCSNQGIRRGAQDVYEWDTDCNWVDITGVAPGDYLLRVRINTEHVLLESDYSNDEVTVAVTVPEGPDPPPIDLSAACEARTFGLDRTCGFTRSHDGECTPGEIVTVGCSATCGYGECTGDTVMLVCESRLGESCTSATAIAANDASDCGAGACSGGRDCCSSATFTCPATGSFTVWAGSYDSARSATCTVARRMP